VVLGEPDKPVGGGNVFQKRPVGVSSFPTALCPLEKSWAIELKGEKPWFIGMAHYKQGGGPHKNGKGGGFPIGSHTREWERENAAGGTQRFIRHGRQDTVGAPTPYLGDPRRGGGAIEENQKWRNRERIKLVF